MEYHAYEQNMLVKVIHADGETKIITPDAARRFAKQLTDAADKADHSAAEVRASLIQGRLS